MAPALTEPLSPTDNLHKTGTATSVPVTRATRRSRAASAATTADTTSTTETTTAEAAAAAAETTTTSTVSVTTSSNTRERKTRNNSTTGTNPDASVKVSTTRVTRSKDNANQRLSEQAAIPAESNNQQATTSNNNKSKTIQKEPMGLSAALDTSNNNNNNNDANTSTSSKNDEVNSDCTEQILADLATNIEEAITADKCLRKQLWDVNIGSDESSKKTNGGAEPNSIEFDESVDSAVADDQQEPKTTLNEISVEGDELKEQENTLNITVEQQEPQQQQDVGDAITTTPTTTTTITESRESVTPTNVELDELSALIAKAESEELVQKTSVQNDETTTTPTPMETNDDNDEIALDSIEARLSQLDGHDIEKEETTTQSPIGETTTTTTVPNILSDNEILNTEVTESPTTITTTTATTTTTPPPILQDDLNDLQEQLQLSAETHDDSTTSKPINTTILDNVELEPQQPQQQEEPQLEHQEQEEQHYNTESTNLNMQIVDANIVGNVGDELVEEVLKVLKGFDPSTANADTLNDLNALFAFSDAYQNITSYDETNATSTAASTSTATNEQIRLIAMTDIPQTSAGEDECVTGSIGVVEDESAKQTVPCQVNWLEDEQHEIVEVQEVLQQKMDFLLLKLRKMQARYMCKHASEEIAGVIEYGVRAANNKLHYNETTIERAKMMSVVSARPPPEIWQEERESALSTSEVAAFLRKLEISAKEQQLCKPSSGPPLAGEVSARKPRKSMDVATTSSPMPTTQHSLTANVTPTTTTTTAYTGGMTNKPSLQCVVPIFDDLASKEIAQVAGMLHSEMRQIQVAIDSDATESSSECESPDELTSYNNPIQEPLEITKRAAWRYANARAGIASRWSWVTSQICDLDIKIRQQNELYNDFVRKKGPVVFDNSANAKKGITFVQQRQLQELQEQQQLHRDLIQPHHLPQLYETEFVEDDESGACRTRCYLAKTFRKRKILTTLNLHTISKKAARPTTIKCGCQWPMQPCTLCTGRTDPTAPRDLPNTMTNPERVALLDGGFHPVLSFPKDVSHAVHFEAIARSPEWQQRVMRCQVKTIAKGVWKAERAGSKKHDNANLTKRRYIKKKDRLSGIGGTSTGAAQVAAEKSISLGGENIGTTTTPLVANKRNKVHYPPTLGEGMTTTTKTEQMDILPNQRHQMTREEQKNDLCRKNRNPTTMARVAATTQISRRNNDNISNTINHRYNNHNRNRKAFSSSSSSSSFSISHSNIINNNSHHHQQQQQQQLPVQYNNSNGNSSSSETTNNLVHINENWDYMTSMRSRTASPTHANTSSTHKYERADKKRNSYDIDNIVIPYSVAAATRVEIIPYKEIPTPRWRVISKNNEEDEDVVGQDEDEVQQTKENPQHQDEEELPNVVEASKTEEAPAAEQNIIMEDQVQENPKIKADEKEESAKEDKIIIEHQVQEITEVESTEKVDEKSLESQEEHKEEESVEEPSPKKIKLDLNEIKLEPTLNESSKIELDGEEFIKEEINSEVVLQNGEVGQDCETDAQRTEDKVTAAQPKTESIEMKESAFKADNEESLMKVEDETTSTTTPVAPRNYEYHDEAFGVGGAENAEENDDDEEHQIVENISDYMMAKRHERALTEERKKFQTYLKFPWTTRSRANRRGDSRAESSGANTPDPSSPALPSTSSSLPISTKTTTAGTNATTNIGDRDQESNNAAGGTSTQTDTGANTTTTAEFAPMESNIISKAVTFGDEITSFENKSKDQSHTAVRKRRRTTSSKKEREIRSITPDTREILPPYEPLKFPLSDEAFDNMIHSKPMDKYTEVNFNSSSTTKLDLSNSVAIISGNSRKSTVGGFGRGRSGLRRQSTHTSSLPARSRSLRARVSNRPYVLNSQSSSIHANTKEPEECVALEEKRNTVEAANDMPKMHAVNGHLVTSDDLAEETEDETETGELGNNDMEAADTDCDDDDEDDEDDDLMLEEDDDDGFLKHPLAAAEYDIHDQIAAAAVIDQTVSSFSREDSSYAAYAGQSDMFSERDSSDADPFQEDDDPNDPEWGNQRRMRKKM